MVPRPPPIRMVAVRLDGTAGAAAPSLPASSMRGRRAPAEPSSSARSSALQVLNAPHPSVQHERPAGLGARPVRPSTGRRPDGKRTRTGDAVE
jgi:hypothetical protein